MNIYLIPHNPTRHVVVGFYTAAAPLLVWWLMLTWLIVVGPVAFRSGLLWAPQAEGTILFSLMAGGIAYTHIAAEGGLRRRAVLWKVGLPLLAGILAMIFTALMVFAVEYLTGMVVGLFDQPLGDLLADPHTSTLRHRLLEWLVAGTVVGVSTLLVRVVWGFSGPLAKYIPEKLTAFIEIPTDPPKVSIVMAVNHLVGGPATAMVGAAVWQLFSHVIIKDMYLASALGFTTWGFLYGFIVWGVPSDLYAGWIRILSSHRFGHRIPIDNPEGGYAERVLGHYPRGLDVCVGAEHGVMELHASFVVDGDGHYGVRGLSQQPVMVKRTLESIDLSYDPASPVPLETDLKMEDRVYIGAKGNRTLVEFVLLPKEER